MEGEVLFLIIFLISAVVVLGILEFAMGDSPKLKFYKVCGLSDSLMTFMNPSYAIKPYFCHSI